MFLVVTIFYQIEIKIDMGRVSKHKKIKSCDPFYKGPRKEIVRKGNFPPANDGEQMPPKTLLRLFKSNTYSHRKNEKHKEAIVQTKQAYDSSKTSPKRREKKEDSLKPQQSEKGDVEGKPAPSKDRAAMFIRQSGESTRAYLKRIDVESKMKVAENLRKAREKSDKRKRYMKERKTKLNSKVKMSDEVFKDFDDFKDLVKFGEVVKAPPKLCAKPRGSQFQSRDKKNYILSSLSKPPVVTGLKHERDMEEERTRVVSEYRLAKEKRKKLY